MATKGFEFSSALILEAIIMSLSSSVALSFGSLSTGVRESHLELLINISQCSETKCSHTPCSLFKKDVHNLEAALKKGESHLNQENTTTLRLLHEHYLWPCELPNCRVPWCRFMSYRRLESQGHTLQELMTLLNCPMLTLLPQGTEFDEFIKLDPELTTEVVEWEHWLILTPLSPSHTVALATPFAVHGQSRHWVIKMTALQEGDNQLRMLEKLRGLQHPHIIAHIWAASCDAHNVLVVCTEYLLGRSVKDVLEETTQLSCAQTRFFFLQALYAARRLHELDIVFLNWKCSNLLLDASEETVKVSNFGTSVDLSSNSADLGTIKLTLPADIVPAEVLQNGQVTHQTDSWGLACLLHEMLTGVRPWYHLRHESQEHIWKQILTQAPPEASPDLPERVQTLTHTCLQKSPDSRPSVEDMISHLHAELD